MGDLLDLLELLETSYFRAGLRLGIVALVAGWALRFALGRYRPPLPIAGLLIAATTVGGLYLTGEPLGSAIPALGLMVAGLLLVRALKAPRWTQIVATIPGAVWLAFWAPVTELLWVRVLMAVLIPIGGFLITDFERRHDRMGLGVIFLTLAILGLFAAVPDTEEALIISAAAVPITLLAWPRAAASLGIEGSYVALAMFLWVTAAGGGERPPSIIGTAACLGLLLLEPVLVALRPNLVTLMTRMRRNWLGAVLASIPQFVLVVICSRIAARFTTEPPAILVVGFAYVLTLAVGWYVGSRELDPRETAVSPF